MVPNLDHHIHTMWAPPALVRLVITPFRVQKRSKWPVRHKQGVYEYRYIMAELMITLDMVYVTWFRI